MLINIFRILLLIRLVAIATLNLRLDTRNKLINYDFFFINISLHVTSILKL